MPSLPDYRRDSRLVILLHGGIESDRGKTGLALLRFAPERVAAVIDAETAGQSLTELTGIPLPRSVPIVATAREALAYRPEVLAIGIAPSGGQLPEAWLDDLQTVVDAGLSVLNGLHTPLAGIPQLANRLRPGQQLWDIRTEPPRPAIATGGARLLSCRRVLFVGTDMSVGKMSAAIAMDRAARSAGLRSKFVATGQTGIMLEGDGFPLDAVRVDFAAGVVQQEVCAQAIGQDVVWVEGQGSLLNPASTATLPLLRGSQPTHLVLVHKAEMNHPRDFPWIPVPPLRDVVRLYEMVASAGGAMAPAPVAAIALNGHRLPDDQLDYHCRRITAETGLPCVDVVRRGGNGLLQVFGL